MIEDNSIKVECKAHDRGSTNVDFLYPLREFRPNYVTIKINSKAKRVPLQCDFHTNESWRRSGNNRRCEVKCIVHSSYDLLSTPIQAFGVSPGMASPLNSPVILYPFMSLLPLPGFFWVFFFFFPTSSNPPVPQLFPFLWSISAFYGFTSSLPLPIWKSHSVTSDQQLKCPYLPVSSISCVHTLNHE